MQNISLKMTQMCVETCSCIFYKQFSWISICNTIQYNGWSNMNMYERNSIVWWETRRYPELTWAQKRNQSRENVEMISIRIMYIYIYEMSLFCLKILVSKVRLSSVKEAIAYFYDLPASYNKKLSVSWYSPSTTCVLVSYFL